MAKKRKKKISRKRISRKRISGLKKAIVQTKKLQKLARKGQIELAGYRPMIALQIQLDVYRAELARAKAGKEPLYKYQWYSDL